MDLKFLALLLLSSVALASGYPPTTVQDSLDTAPINTYHFEFPNFTGSHSGITYTLGVNSIAGGGTGQITANAALNALLPSQSTHAGEALFTNGTSTLWQAAAGTGTVTTVTSSDGSIDITNPTTTPNIQIHFPISAPNGSVSAPSYRFDPDSGAYSTGDGTYNIGTNGVAAVQIDNNQNVVVTGTVTAPNFIYPSQTAKTFLAAPNAGAGVPSFRLITSGDISSSALPFPMFAPTSTAATPSYAFDTDTGMYSVSDGTLDFSTNAVKALEINNNQQAVFTSTVAATDFIYPVQTAHTFLSGPTSGSPAIPNFRLIQPGDLSYDDIPFPLNAPNGSAGAPSYNFDADSGMYGISDGVFGFSTNGVERLRLENNGAIIIANGGSGSLTVNGDGIFTGNISAANYPPVDTANTLARFDNAGSLDASSWSIDPDYSSLTSIVSPGSGTVADFWQIRTQTNLSSDVTSVARALQMSLSNSATTNALVGAQFDFSLPVTNNATLLSLGASNATTVGGDLHALDVAIDSPVTGQFILSNAGTSNTVGGDYTGYYLNAGNTVTGSATLYAGSFYGSAGNDLSYLTLNGSGNAGNNFRGSSLSNSGTIAQFGSGYSVSQSGVVTKGYDAFSANVSANVGDGTGVNLNFLNATVGSGVTVDGSLFLSSLGNQADVTGQIFGSNIVNSGTYAGMTGLSLNNAGNMTGNNNFFGTSITNSGTAYNFIGANYNNTGALTEQFTGVNVYDNGGARTASGASIVLQGTYTDDIRGLKVDVSGATSTNQTAQGLEITGGKQTIYGIYQPKSSAFVDIGSYFAQTATIPNGSPLTGTDMFMQMLQSNLNADDDISGSPLGLDVNMVGAISQLTIGSGKTVPLVRSFLLGTSIPSGSGGTLTEHVGLEIVGLPSFGGSVTNPTRTMMQDSQLLGQNFCDGATTCFGYRMRDANAINSFGQIVIGNSTPESGQILDVNGATRLRVLTTAGLVTTDSSGHLSSVANSTTNIPEGSNLYFTDARARTAVTAAPLIGDVEIQDGHLLFDQTTPPTATVQASAGTGATCTLSADSTDSSGEMTIVTGTLGLSTGSYCKLTFDEAYSIKPHCIATPASSTLSTSVYFPSTTTDADMSFAVAGGITSTYVINYFCPGNQ